MGAAISSAGASVPSPETQASYREAIALLLVFDRALDFTATGAECTDSSQREQRLLELLSLGESATLRRIQTELSVYVDGQIASAVAPVGNIPPTDPTLRSFLDTGRNLMALIDRMASGADAAPSVTGHAIVTTSAAWLKLAGSVLQLHGDAEQRQIDADWAALAAERNAAEAAAMEAFAQYEREERESGGTSPADDYSTAYSGPDDDGADCDGEEEDPQVEDVATWLGPKGSWT